MLQSTFPPFFLLDVMLFLDGRFGYKRLYYGGEGAKKQHVLEGSFLSYVYNIFHSEEIFGNKCEKSSSKKKQ